MLEELERVRAYRSDVPGPSAEAVTAARAELMDVIRRAPQPRQDINARVVGERKQQRKRRLILAGGLAAVGITVAGIFGLSTVSSPPSALAAEMNQVAQVAASQAWTGIPAPGQYLYTESEGLTQDDGFASGRTCAIDLIDHRRIWIATNGSGALAESFSSARFTSVPGEITLAEDQANCADQHITNPASEDTSGASTFPRGGLSFPTENWKALSTDPAVLLKQIHRIDGGPNDPGELFVNVGDFLRESDAPPAIRAALYKTAALIPGVQLMGPQTDELGRTGLGIDFPYADGRPHAVLIIDQSTAALLAEKYYAPNGSLSGWTTYQPSKIANTHPNYPLVPEPSSNSSTGTSTTPQPPSTTTSEPATTTSAGTTTTSARPVTTSAPTTSDTATTPEQPTS